MLDPQVQAELIAAAVDGDQQAWSRLVDAFSGLIWSLLRSHGMYGADGADIFQTVWLRGVEHLGGLRDPAMLAAWLATTTRRECYRVTRRRERVGVDSDLFEFADPVLRDPSESVIVSEQLAAFRSGLAKLGAQCQSLLRLLCLDPPLSYDDVSSALDIPKGSIGPTRQRCLERLRRVLDEGKSL
jgi:RNA polymerase sigma factor (sigma-70 family)